MKNIDIKEMNAKQRLEFANIKTKFYGRQTLIYIVDNKKITYDYQFKLWFNVTLNMYKMRGITYIGKNSLLI